MFSDGEVIANIASDSLRMHPIFSGEAAVRSSVARSSFMEMDATSGAKVSASQPRIRVGKALKPIVVVFAVLYFLIDANFFGLKSRY
jgi:hypothetical protein